MFSCCVFFLAPISNVGFCLSLRKMYFVSIQDNFASNELSLETIVDDMLVIKIREGKKKEENN